MFVGFDTSNYTTSAALFDGETVMQYKKMLEVKKGERGLRQSDAVFQHTVNMPHLLNALKGSLNCDIKAIGVSSRPRSIEGSYMPCFLVGESTAFAASVFSGAPVYKTSHQVGHILAALYSAKKLDLVERPFIAFHVSGGTTEAVLVTPDRNEIISAGLIAESTDLKAGQAVDRTGVLLGMRFPCGSELERLALKSEREFKIKPSMKGCSCSLSGVENKVIKMLSSGEAPEDIAKFTISYISASLEKMAEAVLAEYGNLPIIFAGGVSGNKMINSNLSNKFGAYFAQPQFSSDNAAGVAIYAYMKSL